MRQPSFPAQLAAAMILLGGAEAAAQTRTWTLDADFDAGTLSSVAHVPSNQLVLGKTAVSSTTLVWATNYLYGYVVRIDSSTGKQTGRFDSALVSINGQATGAQAAQNYCNSSNSGNCPGRVAVDTNGDVWIVNRGFGQQGTLSKFSGNLAHCIDRNDNGVIDTSVDANNDGIIDVTSAAEYFGQSDECILTTIKIGPVNALPRGVAVDKKGRIWVSTYNDGGKLYRYNPNEPVALEATVTVGGNPYSLATGGDYVFVSNRGSGGSKRVHIDTFVQATSPCPATNYGVVADPTGSHAWIGGYGSDGVYKADYGAGTCVKYAGLGGQTTATTLDLAGNVWVANYQNHTVHKVSPAGVVLGTYPAGGTAPHGLSVDFQGFIWVINHGPPSVAKIDPSTGALLGSYGIGGPGIANADPYLYSDFTGVQVDRQAPYTYVGSWDAVYDGGVPSLAWSKLSWNAEAQGATPAPTTLAVSLRASDSLATLGATAYVPATNAAAVAGVIGRYVQVRADLKGPGYLTPVLSDVTVVGPCPTPGETCCVVDAHCADADLCSTDTCPTPGGACVHASTPGCCLVDGDCNDMSLCTTDTCPVPGGQCSFAALPGCCMSNLGCFDGDLCTVDLCSGLGGTCSHPVINGCCNSDLDCTKGNICSSATCPVPGGFCVGGAIPGCCTKDADCADVDLCTSDVCDVQTATCANAPVPGCCNVDGQCDDGNTCTTDTCSGPGGACVHAAVAGCCSPDDPTLGAPCDLPISPNDKLPCKAGALACDDGVFTCVGAVKPALELCDHIDNDCDGAADSPPPCPVGTTCVNGVCAPPCSEGEFDCPGGQCVDGLCVPLICDDVICPAGEACVGGLCGADGGVPSATTGTGTGSGTGTGAGTGAGGGAAATSSGAGGDEAGHFGLTSGGACRCEAPGASGGHDGGGRLALALGALSLALRKRARRVAGGARS